MSKGFQQPVLKNEVEKSVYRAAPKVLNPINLFCLNDEIQKWQ